MSRGLSGDLNGVQGLMICIIDISAEGNVLLLILVT